MQKKILFVLALLCTVVQGAWADDYKYPTKTKPAFYTSYGGKSNVVVLRTPAELAYVTEHFSDDSGFDVEDDDWSELNYYLDADIDMGTDYSWLPMGRESSRVTPFVGTFWGNGHTIRFKTWFDDNNTTKENQGLFSTIRGGEVYDLNVVCDIKSDDDFVGGIAGENRGVIQNCTVTGSIYCEDTTVGGIAGRNWGTIRGCVVNATIKTDDNQVGGIVGVNEWKVEDCRVSGTIDGHNAREIGGIAGTSRGAGSYVRNCWASCDVTSDWTNKAVFYGTDLGGIVGDNGLSKIQYCCMTGNVTNDDADVGGIVGSSDPWYLSHCTFYGTRYSNHSQKNPYMGGGDGADSSEMHGEGNDLSNDEAVNSYLSRVDPQYSIYRYAVQYPFAVNVKNEGNGAFVASVERTRSDKTVTLTRIWGTSWNIHIKDADGNPIEFTSNDNVYTFTMPRRDVNVIATFTSASQLLQTAGTADDPYLINSTERWNEFVWRVNHGNSFSGKYLRLDADITITTTAGLYGDNPFSGTFLGNGHTLTANLSSTTTGTGWNEEGVAPFHYIKDATIKDLTVAGTIASATYHTAGIVGFAFGTNLIEGCTVTATLNQNNNYAGGIIGHGENSTTTLKDCVFAGTVNGVGSNRANIGGLWGWSNTGNPVFQNCLEAGTYHNISSMHPMGLHGASGTISGGYYLNPQIGSPDQVCTVTGATQVSATAPTGELYQSLTINGRTFYVTCSLSGNDVYAYTGSEITIDEPTVIGAGGTTLTKGSDYTFTISPSTVKEMGVYTVTFNGNGSTCYGTKTVQIYVLDGNVAGTLTSGKYMINADVTVEDRITISGNVVLHLGEGATLTAKKGIELSTGNTLTIEGKGALTINGCDDGKSGIGAKEAGTLVINGGNITVKGGYHAAALGGDGYNTDGGSITINGGVVRATGGTYAAGIGGGHGNPSYQMPDGLCGDIVIKGGQVYACGGDDAPGIGAGAKSLSPNFKAGTLTLSWTNPDDYIHSTNTTPSKKGFAVNSITFAEGKQFLFYGTSTIVTADNIEGGKIVPYVKGIPGEGTEANPYTISNADEWNLFADAVYGGNAYNGKVVKLMEDISVTTMVGTDDAHSFQGTFDGNGKTLTFNKGTDESPFGEQYCAPFRHVKNATIKNLHADGTLYTSAQKAAGIVGESHGALTLTDCRSSVSIHSNKSGDGTHGGLVSTLSGANNTVTIDRCVFDGSFATTAGTTNCGGFIGWPVWNRPTISNSLMKPSSVDAGMLVNTFARWHTTYEPAITDCYFVAVDNLPADQGTQVYASAPESEIYKQVTAVDGNTYYMPCTVSGVQEGYLYTGGDITVTAPTVTAADGTKLTPGTDFTYSPATVQARDNYTLTVSGTGNYGGSQGFAFVVGDYTPVTSTMTAMTTESYMVYNDVTINGRITIDGEVELYLGEGTTLRARKGIELSDGNRLTIWGPGALIIDKCDDGKSGIGAATAGILTINGGQLTIAGGANAAGIGSDASNAASGKLTLGWTDSDDYIDCSSYLVSSDFRFNASFVINGKQTIATPENIGGRKAVPAVVMADKGDNTATLARSNGKQVTAALDGRTLYLDGKWNTLCLPFDYDISGLKGVEARTLANASIEGTTLNLNFGDAVSTLKAGTPYIIKFDLSSEYAEGEVVDFSTLKLDNPIFEGVTIDETVHNYDNGESGDARVRFLGTYKSTTFDAEDKSILFMGAANTLYYPESGASIGAQRAYFKIGDGAALAHQLTAFHIGFGEGDEATGIISLTPDPSPNGEGSDYWYSLDGRRLNGKPSRAGVYIYKGVKVAIK